MLDTLELAKYPALNGVLKRQIERTPDYEASLIKRISTAAADELPTLERIAVHIGKLVGPHLDQYCDDYQWICEALLEEELHFRRTGNYRHSRFQEAYDEIYSNSGLMSRYMNGLLMTQLWWSNHTGVFNYYERNFIPRLKQGYRHLEIGSGHGLYMFPPALDPRHGTLTAWDVSEQSIIDTTESLRRLGVDDVSVVVQDMFDADPSEVGQFDSITFSEVLEHLEQPGEALLRLADLLSKDGYLFVHMPINSPAPDHLFLLRTPEEVIEFVEGHGFVVIQSHFEPQTGMTLQAAREKKKTISVALISQKAKPNGMR